jgi:uncharacterized protein (TIGR02453 family)
MERAGFTGFPPGAVTFLEGLRENNNKTWFEAHRGEYEGQLLEPTRTFAEDMAERLNAVVAPSGQAFVGSLFRIYRDVRFSKDKSPYKSHVGIVFGPSARSKTEAPGFYFHLEPPNIMLGAGLHMFPKPVLERYRDTVADPDRGPELRQLLDGIVAQGYDVWGKTYKRVPAGFDPDQPNAGLLLYSGVFAGLTEPIPPEFYSAAFLDHCEKHYRVVVPVLAWLERVVGAAEG